MQAERAAPDPRQPAVSPCADEAHDIHSLEAR